MPGFITQPLRLMAFLLIGASALIALHTAGEVQAGGTATNAPRVAMAATST